MQTSGKFQFERLSILWSLREGEATFDIELKGGEGDKSTPCILSGLTMREAQELQTLFGKAVNQMYEAYEELPGF